MNKQKGKTKKRSIAVQMPVIAFVMLVIAAMTTGLIGFFLYRASSISYNQEVVQAVSHAVAAYIDPDEYEAILQSGEKTTYWYEMKDYFNRTKERTGIKYLYAMNNDVDGSIMFVVEGQTPEDDPATICELGEVLPVGSYTDALFLALSTGQPQVGDVHEVQGFGSMVSGYAPILDEQGSVLGVVGADYDVEIVLKEVEAFGLMVVGISLVIALGFGVLLLLYIRRNITRPINDVIGIAHDIVEGNIEHVGDVSESAFDELGNLSSTAQKLFEKAKGIDPLTGAYNRDMGMRTLERLLESGKMDSVAVFIDIDGLKSINDQHGHTEGDYVIRTVAGVIAASTRENDIFCRYGGDEFLLIFKDCDQNMAENIMQRMQERLAEINEFSGKPYKLGFSYGLRVVCGGGSCDAESVVAAIDKSMYKQKQGKKEQ